MAVRQYTLRRCCGACARAKRRCNLQSPSCERCQKRGLSCSYDNEPVSCRPLPRSSSHGDEHITENGLRLGRMSNRPLSLRYLVPQRQWTWDMRTVQYIVDYLTSFPVQLANQGRTPFLHSRLYRGRAPKALRDAYTICSAYYNMTPLSNEIFADLLDIKATELVQHSQMTSFDDLLASIQALIIIQIIRLFGDAYTHEGHDAEGHNYVLSQWTARLLELVPSCLDSSWHIWDAWLFAESVRRTIITVYLLNAVCAVLKHGDRVQALHMNAIPLDLRTFLWDEVVATRSDEVPFVPLGPSSFLVSWHEYSVLWNAKKMRQVSEFGEMLLVASLGLDTVKGREGFEVARWED